MEGSNWLVDMSIDSKFLHFALVDVSGENKSLSESPIHDVLAGIVNPFYSTCYDWRGDMYGQISQDTQTLAT